MTDALFRARDVTRSYAPAGGGPATTVLKGVSLDGERGGFTALMGSSGSGKTTLLNLVGGLDAPDSGSVEVDGQRLDTLDDDRRSDFRLRRVGFVFQFFNLLPNLSVRENIALPALFLGTREKDAGAKAAALADEVGLAGKLDRRIHQLSGGEMQRVAIARALVHDPILLLADEPTGNLDSRTGDAILELIRRVRERHGLTILMATHDAEAAAAADRVLHMRDGVLVQD
jgi:ABC-type lipoprotein export system ATPase subunit